MPTSVGKRDLKVFYLRNLYAQLGAWIHDPEIKSLTLFRLNQRGPHQYIERIIYTGYHLDIIYWKYINTVMTSLSGLICFFVVWDLFSLSQKLYYYTVITIVMVLINYSLASPGILCLFYLLVTEKTGNWAYWKKHWVKA